MSSMQLPLHSRGLQRCKQIEPMKDELYFQQFLHAKYHGLLQSRETTLNVEIPWIGIVCAWRENSGIGYLHTRFHTRPTVCMF
jgi:hypothetical protein